MGRSLPIRRLVSQRAPCRCSAAPQHFPDIQRRSSYSPGLKENRAVLRTERRARFPACPGNRAGAALVLVTLKTWESSYEVPLLSVILPAWSVGMRFNRAEPFSAA